LAELRSSENSELPKCVSYPEQKPSRFVVSHQELEATKKSPIYIHTLGRRGRHPLVRAFLGGGMNSPRGEEGLVVAVANNSVAY
jgi:hypothetical protein